MTTLLLLLVLMLVLVLLYRLSGVVRGRGRLRQERTRLGLGLLLLLCVLRLYRGLLKPTLPLLLLLLLLLLVLVLCRGGVISARGLPEPLLPLRVVLREAGGGEGCGASVIRVCVSVCVWVRV